MAVTAHSPSAVADRADGPPRLVTAPTCPAAVREAYHALWTNVELALGPTTGRLIAVAALDDTAQAAPVAANLALVAAEGGDRTLLVDGDVRTPTLHALFDVAAAPGLAQFLTGTHDDPGALAQPTPAPHLGVIAAGVGPARFDRLDRLGDVPGALRRLAEIADRVILVVAPVLAGTAALQVGAHVDGVVLVVTPGQTRRQEAERAIALLRRATVPVLGVALAS